MDYKEKSEHFSAGRAKLLSNADVLNRIQNEKKYTPITVQIAPTEACSLKCEFCSVANRNKAGKIPFKTIITGLQKFALLGAKSVEITGGGDPLLYKDRGFDINSIVDLAYGIGLSVGIITAQASLEKYILSAQAKKIDWLRVSLSGLDQGRTPENYSFYPLHDSQIALSYITNNKTTEKTIEQINKIVEKHKEIKFVRIAPDCLTDDSTTMNRMWEQQIKEKDKYNKMFIKQIGTNYKPFPLSCQVGATRPYWTHAGVFICTSHVLINRQYDMRYQLCDAENITQAWTAMNQNLETGKPPYPIDVDRCGHCYYHDSNEVLHYVANQTEDRDFA